MKIYENYKKEFKGLSNRLNTSIRMMLEIISDEEKNRFLSMLEEHIFCDRDNNFVQLVHYSITRRKFDGLSDMVLPKEYDLKDIPLEVRLYMVKLLDVKIHEDVTELESDGKHYVNTFRSLDSLIKESDNIGQDPDYYEN